MTRKSITVAAAIDNLKFISCLQDDVIGRLQEYARVLTARRAEKVVRTGSAYNYESELGYLKQRHEVLDAVIRSVERLAGLTWAGFS